MTDEGTQFYGDDKKFPLDLEGLVDDTVKYVYIETPEDWVCPRKGCTTEVLHKHGTYDALNG